MRLFGRFRSCVDHQEIDATPFAQAPSIVIAYPHFEDWKRLYNPRRPRFPRNRRSLRP
jgi:hypothetical protein